MTDSYIKLPEDLLQKTLRRVHKEQRILVFKKITILSLLLSVSLAGLIPAFNALSYDFSQSGFINFLSLTFSDFSVVLSHWQSFAMILLESLPVISLALFLAVLLVFLQSIKSLTKNIKIISGINSLTTARQ
jgi:hypothetical protein